MENDFSLEFINRVICDVESLVILRGYTPVVCGILFVMKGLALSGLEVRQIVTKALSPVGSNTAIRIESQYLPELSAMLDKWLNCDEQLYFCAEFFSRNQPEPSTFSAIMSEIDDIYKHIQPRGNVSGT